MDKFDRIQQLHRLLRSHRRPVSLSALAERMECSERTVRRLIDTLRDQLDAPIEYSETAKAWHYADSDESRYELPGLWLTANEMQSLAVLLSLLDNIGPGLLSQELKPLEKEINKLLSVRGIETTSFHASLFPTCVGMNRSY